MSNIITNLCRPLRLQPVRKCVLMALADRADDNGIAWPSLAWLCEWTCFSRRAVMNALDDLAQAGIVQVNKIAGKNSRCEIDLEKLREEAANPGTTCTSTQAPGARVDDLDFDQDQGTTCTRAPDAPVQDVHHHPGTTCTSTRAPHAPGGARRAPDTSIDTINTSVRQGESTAARKRTATPPMECPADVQPQTWKDWLALRKQKKANVTHTVLIGARKEAEKAGLSLEAFLQVWCMRGSQGLQAEWLKPSETMAHTSNEHKPDWAISAGFANRWEAQNEGCNERNAHEFRDGKKKAVVL
ncbi:helix-turn-helix domain-containing protein [Comamonas odontotermitis]|uniref:helix-turn-helix domain-containing protein n=1 Tax=Comamonas odontotermitis TaxID=379895 RepID=UPI001CC786AD|nr:helix-turn-helix domain-containing protein [Comamonas odontotermitis]UBB16153.1 helix-turn-helix domain-containing protein [Comamonas odontotermitis]